MAGSDYGDRDVQGWLRTIGVDSLCAWDVLVFLHRHPATLVTPGHLARLTGYPFSVIGTAIASLAAQQLLQLSPRAYGACLYQFCVPSDPSRNEALERLLAPTPRPDRSKKRAITLLDDGPFRFAVWAFTSSRALARQRGRTA